MALVVLTSIHVHVCCVACSGLGYCFSAALPPYLTTAATGAIDKVEREGRQLAEACTANARSLRSLLSDMPGERSGMLNRMRLLSMPSFCLWKQNMDCCMRASAERCSSFSKCDHTCSCAVFSLLLHWPLVISCRP